MMAGTGVNVGGASMLRTRRRDISIKPNRKLDRKSSRGMIYENEELRLRTIHINAEVEQGQNDIKKLRRENEQLRREIWCLRDEYDKLEEILKKQKCHDGNDEYKSFSDEEEALQSSYSEKKEETEIDDYEDNGIENDDQDHDDDDDDDNDDDDEDDDDDYDDDDDDDDNYNVHDAEDEDDYYYYHENGKKDKKEINNKKSDSNQDEEQLENAENLKISSEKISNNLRRLNVNFDDLSIVEEEEELKRCPFIFSTANDSFEGITCSQVCDLTSTPSLESSILDASSSAFATNFHNRSFQNSAIGWQSNLLVPDGINSQMPSYTIPSTIITNGGTTTIGASTSSRTDHIANADSSSFISSQIAGKDTGPLSQIESNLINKSNLSDPSLLYRRRHVTEGIMKHETEASFELTQHRPNHFFAPLPSKITKRINEKNHLHEILHAVPENLGNVFLSDKRKFISSENLLIDENQNNSPFTLQPLVKSISCEELNSSTGNSSFFERMRNLNSDLDAGPQHVKSNPSKAFKSQLSVTLRCPHDIRSETSTSEIPKVPKLPFKKFGFLTNPFLKNSRNSSDYVDFGPEFEIQNSLTCHKNQSCQSLVQNSIYSGQSNQLKETDQLSTPNLNFQQYEIPSSQYNDNNIKKCHKYQITSFKGPIPHTLQISPIIPNKVDTYHQLRTTNPLLVSPNLHRHMPFTSTAATVHCAAHGMQIYYDSVAQKLVAQTQTPNDIVCEHNSARICRKEERSIDATNSTELASLCNRRRKKNLKKEKSSFEKKSASPATQGKGEGFKKQVSISSFDEPESPNSVETGQTSRNCTFTMSNFAEVQEDKNESRSSSSGMDSPKKEQTRRVSLYLNTKKRPSLTSVKSVRSTNTDNSKNRYIPRKDNPDGNTTKLERERINSVNSRDISSANNKGRKTSNSSGSVPWCACWGNGCI